MTPTLATRPRLVAAAACALLAGQAQAYTFEVEGGRGNFDSTVTVGTGIRAKSSTCGLVTDGATGAGAPAGCLAPSSALGDQGNLNYGRGDRFTTYIKGSHELLLKLPSDITVMARANWLRDVSATDTTGVASATSPALSDGLSDEARKDLRFKARVLDLWVSKSFAVGDQQARVRVGNQVISWGESLFLPGGLNSGVAIDVMRLSQPGTQLKEVFLPTPAVSFTSGLGHGLNAEAYVQGAWNGNYFPPTGSYWSQVNGLGKGHGSYGFAEKKARNSGQWGTALRWQPDGTQLNLGLYALNYHDKSPQFSLNPEDTGANPLAWKYVEDRKMFGISANFPVGDWAIGTELSYRPKDAVALNAATDGCASQNGRCYVDEKRLQWHLTGLLSLTPSIGGGILKALGADTATLLAEAVVVRYPNLQRSYGGSLVAAGGWGWGQEFDPAGTPQSVGSKTSWGFNFDFSWVYDGTLIPGWQVVPEVYYFQAVKGRTPNVVGMFMEGAKSTNLTVSFIQNPATWQFAVNYGAFWGGSRVYDQPYRDRNFIGATVSRNF
ncbi:MAG: arylsulfatase [Burkholderiales bacterium PBB5]|nr:MAG: arylsulfatase [Burkholderiales bacterium PBB5]